MRSLFPALLALAATSTIAAALDVEIVAPEASSHAPAAASALAPGGTSAIETGSVAKDPASSTAPDSTAPASPGNLDDGDGEPAIETGSVGDEPEETTAALHGPTTAPPHPQSAVGRAIREILDAEEAEIAAKSEPLAEDAQPAPRPPDERDNLAIRAFYEEQGDAPIWVSKSGLTAKAQAAIAEIKRAGDWGIDTKVFDLPDLKVESAAGADPSQENLTKTELMLSQAILKYHRYARGGAIYDAPQEISSYLDRRPQLRKRKATLEQAANASDITDFLLRMHPQQPEFERLRQAWLEARDGKWDRKRGKRLSADQLLANMQQWRLMPEDMGPFHVWLNVPEYVIRIVKDGEDVFNERVTVGLVNKQTPIFSDEMVRVTFRSKWRVPDSIKVREVWPSLLTGGGMMRSFGLVMTRKDSEEEVDWRKIDWSKADMNDYVLWQPPGGRNQLGVVKFSFPNKHYVFMHDTPDKHMFAWSRRANSHGCMRIRNPLQMASVILGRDKGWDREKIDGLAKKGPDHNIIELDQKVPVHITYFTVRIDAEGKIRTFSDIYGHERKVQLALAGKWDKIAVGRSHLAPLDQTRVPSVVASTAAKGRALRKPKSITELMFGGFGGF